MHNDSQQFFAFFPFFFVGLWLFVTTLLGILSGWWRLQARYPRGQERPILTLRQRSGTMGLGVSMSGILTLVASPSGLQIAIWRVFGPFQRPFLVPWNEVKAEPVQRFFQPMAKLSFGEPTVGKLTVDAASWARLFASAKAAGAVSGSVPIVGARAVATGLFLQWIVITMIAAAFYDFASRTMLGAPGVPLPVCIAFPAIVFGLGQLVRYYRERPV